MYIFKYVHSVSRHGNVIFCKNEFQTTQLIQFCDNILHASFFFCTDLRKFFFQSFEALKQKLHDVEAKLGYGFKLSHKLLL